MQQREQSCRIAELHDRLAGLGVSADTRSRFLRCASACSHSSDGSQQPVFTSGLPGLCAAIQSSAFSMGGSVARVGALRTVEHALQPMERRTATGAVPGGQIALLRPHGAMAAVAEVRAITTTQSA